MSETPILTHSQRAFLLGGVSLFALQGIAACAQMKPAPTITYTPEVATPVGTGAVDTGAVGQPYQPSTDGIGTTLALGEEDGGISAPYDPGSATTLALGEEEGPAYAPVPDSGTATTLAIGEEDGSGPIPVEPDGGIGDGAGPPPFVTTLAIGEEDGQSMTPPIYSDTPTTLAIGEDDGAMPMPGEPIYGIDDGAIPPTDATTLAVGEEDGGIYTPTDSGTVTTLAIGEEDGSGSMPIPSYGDSIGGDVVESYGEPLTVTTFAVGEEG